MGHILGAIILTGGASSRMGADKARLDWNGRRAVDRLASVATTVGATRVVTVGGADLGLPHVMERDRGGPVGGIRNGLAPLAAMGATRMLVLAADAPTVTPADLAPLIAAPGPGAMFAGLYLPLMMDLASFPGPAAAGWAMGRLAEAAGLAALEPGPGAAARLRGANTPAERDALLAELIGREGAGGA